MTDLTKGTLLIVEDEPEIASILIELLSSITPRIKHASNGEEALAIIKSGGIDAVISDINMPKMTGLELLAEVRRAFLQTPFVIVTAFSDKENILEALRLTATDFLEKPFDRKQVRAVVEQVLEYGILLRQMEQAIGRDLNDATVPDNELMRMKYVKKLVQEIRARNPKKTS